MELSPCDLVPFLYHETPTIVVAAKVKRFLKIICLNFVFIFASICDIIEQRKGGGIGEFQGNYK